MALFGAWDWIDHGLNRYTTHLAITDLSRAGKTVFITNLIQTLLAIGSGYNALPSLLQGCQDASGSRLHGISMASPEISALPWFNYQAKLALLASDTPAWPHPTDDLTEASLVFNGEWKQAFDSYRGCR